MTPTERFSADNKPPSLLLRTGLPAALAALTGGLVGHEIGRHSSQQETKPPSHLEKIDHTSEDARDEFWKALPPKEMKIRPQEEDEFMAVGEYLLAVGKPKDAAAKFQRVLRTKPDHPEAREKLGDAYVGLGKEQEALECYQHVVRYWQQCAEDGQKMGRVRDGKDDPSRHQFYKRILGKLMVKIIIIQEGYLRNL